MNAGTQEKIVRSAAIVSIGNVMSRVMGLAREMVISYLFGASSAVDAYTAASIVPLRLYELLVGGMISSALVPTLSEYAPEERRKELWHVASLLFTLAALVLGGTILLLELAAPLVTRVLVGGFDVTLQGETTRLLRIALLGVFFLGLSGMATSLCQSLQRFALPAFTAVVFNASIVIVALLFGRRWGVRSLAVGLVVGAGCQFVLQWPALRGLRFRPALDLTHPVLRRILRLYAPVILGMGATEVGILVDRNLASQLGEATMSFMRFATTLIQFPLGLVSIAVATAILPTLARKAIQESKDGSLDGSTSSDFRATLASGLRLVLVLTLPAAAGLLVLARPVVVLLFQHGAFDASDAAQTALALRLYLIGLVFAAIDQPLVFAFYARKDTLTPALVGVLGVLFYLVVALPTFRVLGMSGLILANGAQLAGHAAVMIWLFQRKVGTLSGHGLAQTLLKSALASTLMGTAVYGTVWAIEDILLAKGRVGSALVVVGGGIIGVGTYLGLCALLRIREIELARALVRQTWQKVRTLRTGRQ